MKSTTFILLSILMFLGSCRNSLSKVEKEIIIDSFSQDLLSMSILMDHSDSSDLLPLLDRVSNEIKERHGIFDTRYELVKVAQSYLTNNNKNKRDSETLNTVFFLEQNINQFEQLEMSFIEEYNFIIRLFNGIYWQNWKDDLGISFSINIIAPDTLYLKENSEYSIPIEVDLKGRRSTPAWIKSNSLQKGYKNKLFVKTETAEDDILSKVFTVNAVNILTNEDITINSSLKYKVVN